GGTNAPTAAASILQVKQAQPGGHGPEQGFLGDGIVTVHALIKNRGQSQSQRKAAQRQSFTGAQPGNDPAGEERSGSGHTDDVQPVTGQRAKEQQGNGGRVVEREKADFFQQKIPQPLPQVLQQILPEGHTLKIVHPGIQSQFVVALRRDADGNAQIHHRKGQYQQVTDCQQQPAMPAADLGD